MDWIESIKARIEAGEDYTVGFGPYLYRVEPRPQGKVFIYFTNHTTGLTYTSLIGRETSIGAAAAKIANHRDKMNLMAQPARHVHSRDCYDDAGPGAGGVSLICGKIEGIDPDR